MLAHIRPRRELLLEQRAPRSMIDDDVSLFLKQKETCSAEFYEQVTGNVKGRVEATRKLSDVYP